MEVGLFLAAPCVIQNLWNVECSDRTLCHIILTHCCFGNEMTSLP